MEFEAKIALKGSGIQVEGVPLISYKINGSRNTSKQSGVTSQINQFFIDLEIPILDEHIHESCFLTWFGSDSADLKGEITTPSGVEGFGGYKQEYFGTINYLFDKGKVHSYDRIYDRSLNQGRNPYILKIGIVAERLSYGDVTVDKEGVSDDKIYDEFNKEYVPQSL